MTAVCLTLRIWCLESAVKHLFNHSDYIRSIRRKHGWITIGYARKFNTNEQQSTRTKLLQKMVSTLHDKDGCQKVYVSPVCNAKSALMTRDINRTAAATAVLGELRHINGDSVSQVTAHQKFVLWSSTSRASPPHQKMSANFLGKFLSKWANKKIKEIVVDGGHHVDSFSRGNLIHGLETNRFDCRQNCVKRSTLWSSIPFPAILIPPTIWNKSIYISMTHVRIQIQINKFIAVVRGVLGKLKNEEKIDMEFVMNTKHKVCV